MLCKCSGKYIDIYFILKIKFFFFFYADEFIYPITRYLDTYIALYFHTPKLPEKHTTNGNEFTFHPPLKLVPLLANYPHSH